MDGLRRRLESQGLRDIVYLVINHQGAQAQHLHAMLTERLSEHIILYRQQEQQPDVWQTLGGEKDDFFIYDRCGRLTHHISLPYSIIGHGHVENVIKDTYCKRICGECTHESTETPMECKEKADARPDGDGPPPVEEDTGHGRHHRHHHGQGQQGGNHGGDHGHRHGNHNGGHGSGHEHGHSQQGVRQQGQVHDDGVFQRQHHLDLGQMQSEVQMLQMPQEPLEGPVRP